MKYYTNEGKIIEIEKKSYIAEGTQGIIFKINDNECAKIYKNDTPRCDSKVFKFFKDNELDGYLELHDLLYSSLDSKDVTGYTMKYYVNTVDNILSMPIEYTISNFNKFYRTFMILAENHILAKDTIPENVIMNENGITLIDFDASCYSELDILTCKNVNFNNLLYLFKRIFEKSIEKLGITVDDEIKASINDLFNINLNNPDILSEKLAYMNTPMEAMPFKCRYR